MEISIIIPVYNQEKYLEQCIQSALEQDMSDYQVLLIDDGSTDGSKEICKRYEAQNPAVQYIYQQNSGLGGARNTGLRFAEGRYLFFLDADDAIESHCLKTLCEYMDENSLDILYMDELICDENLKTDRVSPTYPYMEALVEKEKAFEYCMQPAHICSRIYRRDLFGNIEFSNMWYEDMECYPRLLSVAERIGYYKMPLYYYRQHPTAITHQESDLRNMDVVKAWERISRISGLSEKEKMAVEKAIRKSVAEFMFYRMKYAKKYLQWYHKAGLKDHISLPQDMEALDQLSFLEDYPFMQQARLVADTELMETLRKLDELYLKGGVCYFDDPVKYDDDLKSEHLSFRYEGALKLHCIRVKQKSPVLYYVYRELKKQNLISLKGSRKEYVLEKTLVNAFMAYGHQICVI